MSQCHLFLLDNGPKLQNSNISYSYVREAGKYVLKMRSFKFSMKWGKEKYTETYDKINVNLPTVPNKLSAWCVETKQYVQTQNSLQFQIFMEDLEIYSILGRNRYIILHILYHIF